MKYNVRKLSGGGLATFTPFLPTPSAPASGYTGENKKEEETTQLGDKDLFKDLAGKGLTNDVNYFMSELSQLESDPMSFMKPESRSQLYKKLAKLNEIKNNKELWDNAVAVSKESGGLGEVAVGSNGELFVRTEDKKIQSINLETYKKNRDKYKALSVSELMMARQYDDNLAFDTNIFSVANQAIGLEKITKHVTDLMGILSDYSSKTERYYSDADIKQRLSAFSGKTPTQEEKKSIESLVEILNTPGEYAKVSMSEKGKRQNVGKALNYIWNSLGDNAQKKLQATSSINGYSSTKDYLLDMLMSYTEPQTESSITPVTESNISGTQTEKGLESLTNFQMFHKDKLKDPLSSFSFNDPQTSTLFKGAIGAVGPLMDKRDQTIGFSTLNQILTEYDYNMLIDGSRASFGNKNIGVENLNNLVYDGQNAAKVYMPVGEDGQPDYEGFKEFKEVYSIYENNKDSWTKGEAQKFFRDNGYRLTIDEIAGEKVIRDNAYIKPFLVMYGYTNDATQLTDDNPWVKKLSSKEEKDIMPILDQIWTIGTGKNTKNIKPQGGLFGEDYYKGIITIPYRTTHAAVVDALVKQGPRDKISTITDVQRNINHSSNLPVQTGNADYLNQE